MSIEHFDIQLKLKYIQIVHTDDANNYNNYTTTNDNNAPFERFFARNIEGNINDYSGHIIILNIHRIRPILDV